MAHLTSGCVAWHDLEVRRARYRPNRLFVHRTLLFINVILQASACLALFFHVSNNKTKEKLEQRAMTLFPSSLFPNRHTIPSQQSKCNKVLNMLLREKKKVKRKVFSMFTKYTTEFPSRETFPCRSGVVLNPHHYSGRTNPISKPNLESRTSSRLKTDQPSAERSKCASLWIGTGSDILVCWRSLCYSSFTVLLLSYDLM